MDHGARRQAAGDPPRGGLGRRRRGRGSARASLDRPPAPSTSISTSPRRAVSFGSAATLRDAHLQRLTRMLEAPANKQRTCTRNQMKTVSKDPSRQQTTSNTEDPRDIASRLQSVARGQGSADSCDQHAKCNPPGVGHIHCSGRTVAISGTRTKDDLHCRASSRVRRIALFCNLLHRPYDDVHSPGEMQQGRAGKVKPVRHDQVGRLHVPDSLLQRPRHMVDFGSIECSAR